MKILFLTPQCPFPPHQGTTIRNFHLLASLAGQHQLALLTFAEPGWNAEDTPLAALCEQIVTVPLPPARSLIRRGLQTLFSPQPDMGLRLWSLAFQKQLLAWVQTEFFDVIQVEGIELGRYALALRRSGALGERTRLVFDDHNAEYVLQRRAFTTDIRQLRRWPAAGYSCIQWRKLRRFERAICRAADQVVAVSAADAAALCRLVPGLTPAVVPNGVDIQFFHPQQPFEPPRQVANLVFTGKMDFRPNVDAMLWFCNEVFPRIRAVRPDVTLAIVGQAPHRRIQALAGRPGIVVTGFVKDVRPYLATADICIVPLRIGGGTRLKVLEAMAMGKALVSTRLGVEGLPVQTEEHLVLADEPEEFAAAVLALLADPVRRQALGARARQWVEREYAWSAIAPRLEALYHHLAPAHSPA